MKKKLCLSLTVILWVCFGHAIRIEANSTNQVLLLIDNSGSMKKNDPEYLIKDVVNNFVTSLDEKTHLGIYLFDQTAREIVPLTPLNNKENKEKCINSLKYFDYKGAYTNIPAVMEKSVYKLKQLTDSNTFKSIIFITDGYIDTGDKDKDTESRNWLIESLATDAKKHHIKIFGIAFTENADFQLIQGVTTKTNGEYFRVYKANEIESVFEKIIKSIETSIHAETKPEVIVQTVTEQGGRGINTKVILIGIIVIIALLVTSILLSKRKQKVTVSSAASETNQNLYIPNAKLIDLDKATSEDEIIISNELTTLGRNQENTICLENAEKTVTGLSHTQIVFQDNSFFIKDLSTNYTKLNDEKLQKKKLVKLNNEDVISIMKYRFQFVLPDSLGQTMIITDSSISNGSETIIEQTNGENNNSEIVQSETSQLQAEKDKNSKSTINKKVTTSEISEEQETLIKPKSCPNHLQKEPTDVCEVCCQPFCEECLTETGSKTMCKSCADKQEK